MNDTEPPDKPPDIPPLQKSNDNSTKTNTNNIDFQNRYRPCDTKPYFVYVEHKDKNIGRLFPVRVGHYLFTNELFRNSIEDIKSVGLNRVKVIFKSYKAANALINHEIITSNNLIAYIPKFFTQKKGIIRMVDTYFSEEYLLNNIESDIPVVEVKRMLKKIIEQDGNPKLVKRQVVIVTFLGNAIPKNIKISLVNFPVEPYVYPVIQCFKCLRYGHTLNLCKSNKRCKFCSGEHDENNCELNSVYCVFCKTGEHSSVDKKCPVYIKQQNIKRTMAAQNISFKEAETIVNNPSYAKVTTNNRFSLLADQNNFPNLPNPSQSISGNYSDIPRRPIRNNHSQQLPVKRKAGKPLERTNVAPPMRENTSSSSNSSQCVLPNPYREEFLAYKESLVEEISGFINNLIASLVPSGASTIVPELNVKESLSNLFKHPNLT